MTTELVDTKRTALERCTFCGAARTDLPCLAINDCPPGTHWASICEACAAAAVNVARDERQRLEERAR